MPICGCGKEGRYEMRDGNYACNKYIRCPEYSELQKANTNLLRDFTVLIGVVQDLTKFHEGTDHYENALEEYEKICEKRQIIG
jgi:hypothetical protein